MSLFHVVKKGLKARKNTSTSKSPSAPAPETVSDEDEFEKLDDLLRIDRPVLPTYKEVLQADSYSAYNVQLSVHTTLTVSKSPLTKRDKVKLLYGLAMQYSGDKIILGGILYVLYNSLLPMDLKDKYAVIDERCVLSGYYSDQTPVNLVREGNHQMIIDIPGIMAKVVLSYKSSYSIFPGEEYPECMPPLLRDIFKRIGSIQVIQAPNGRFIIK
ncbi:M protein [Eptesicus fuscus rhabdovirus]|uniref:M protein n=1 Tax=Eptesicus fuscus rhabdovirus TaxID=2793798 RepID=A0A7T1KMV1_9RHAB|nr:M protein [Eptesicus fuscus rhabdovirus]